MLTEQDIKILETEDRSPRQTGTKTRHIVEALGLSPAPYSVRLHQLVRRHEVIAAWPQLAYGSSDCRISGATTEKRCSGSCRGERVE